jgi:CheY-like chemotaxis protein
MKKSVLLIEDDPSIRDVIKIMLENAGYAVSASDSGECILHDEFLIPDLFLIDKLLSGIDGLDICKYLKSKSITNQVPVIIISASPNVAAMAKHACADGFIEKPFERNFLLETIAKHLNG